jgi:hypothetical protein
MERREVEGLGWPEAALGLPSLVASLVPSTLRHA